MILTEAQYRILCAIGETPGTNAYALRNVLNLHQSGINRFCNGFVGAGYISVEVGENEKGRPVNRLQLTLRGFAVLVPGLLHFEEQPEDDFGPEAEKLDSKFNRKVLKILKENSGLHEGISIFKDFFAFVERNSEEVSTGGYMLNRLYFALKTSLENLEYAIRFNRFNASDSFGSYIDTMIYNNLYEGLLFNLAETLDPPSSCIIPPPRFPPFARYFEEEILPKYQNSEGRDLIRKKIEERISRIEEETQKLELLKNKF